MVLNMKQFNGKHACHLCEDEGQTQEGNTLIRFWPYAQQQSQKRTKEGLIKNAIDASAQKEPVSHYYVQ